MGHSERRSSHGESNALVKSKATAALEGGLSVIICVGESELERKAGTALATVEKQVVGSLPESSDSINTVVAYEPVWAIGTGTIPTTEEISEMHLHISSVLEREMSDPNAEAIRLLYGGSVNPKNSSEILRCARVNGALVGGASLPHPQEHHLPAHNAKFQKNFSDSRIRRIISELPPRSDPTFHAPTHLRYADAFQKFPQLLELFQCQ